MVSEPVHIGLCAQTAYSFWLTAQINCALVLKQTLHQGSSNIPRHK